jgi:D-alanine-D-alanine ligase
MTLAHGLDERAPALDEAFRFDDVTLVERYLAGARDVEVAVIGNEPDALELYGPGEILSGHEFYDYAAKYTPGLSQTTTTAEVTPVQRATLLKLARDAYRACGCEGFARIDFLLAGEELVISEINTIPGFTPISLFPTMPASGGYDFGAVCRRVVDLALERHAGRVRHRLTAADLPR